MRIAIFTEDMYEDVEFWYPYYRLKEAGHDITVIGSGTKDSYKGKHGIENKVDISIRDARADDYDALVIPGGYAPDKMRLHPEFAEFTALFDTKGKLIASLCHGPWILASAGILRGRKVTCWPSLKDDMINAGARYQDSEVVVSDNIITSRGPQDLPAFMSEVVSALSASERERTKMPAMAGR